MNKNMVTENGKKYIAPRDPHVSIMKWVVEEIAKGNYAIDQIRKMASSKCPYHKREFALCNKI